MRRPAGVAAVLVALLVGCAPAPAASPSAGGTSASGGASDATLIAARKAAGLPDCEVPDAVAPLAGGLPDLALACLGSTRSVNLAHLRGRPMVINLWAEWCPPCRQEAPYLRDFARLAGDQVRIIGIDVEDPKPADAIRFAGGAGWTYEHLADPTGAVKQALAVPGLPTTLFVDADGRVVYRHTGALVSTDALRTLVARHLKVSV